MVMSLNLDMENISRKESYLTTASCAWKKQGYFVLPAVKRFRIY